MMNQFYPGKCITCHAGNRDSYQLSVALYEKELLDMLITDFYTPDLLRSVDKNHKRYSHGLPSKKVTSVWINFIRRRISKGTYIQPDSKLSEYAVKKAIQHQSNLFLSSYTAYEAFSKIKNERLANGCLLFQLHPHPLSIRKILEEEIELVPVAKNSILSEHEMNEDTQVLERLAGESALADHCVTASSFTKKTLLENGIAENKITVVPYGVDGNRFPPKKEYNTANGYLNIIFVGQMVQRKGLYYLLEAIKKINSPHITITLVGRGRIDEALLKNYTTNVNINIKIGLSNAELVKEFHQHDVLVFPSLVEGFGQVILEAMSSGLPVICTENTAGPDLFLTGNEGMIVPLRDTDTLAEKIEWCVQHKNELKEMGMAAAQTAGIFNWAKFRKGIVNVYNQHSIKNRK